MKRLIEIACFNVEAALIAAKQGAHRIELCTNYALGGITPPIDIVQAVMQQVNIPVHVMVRPRGGDFVYTAHEIHEMVNTITSFKNLGVAGIVSGVLTKQRTIDLSALSLLLAACKGSHFTFHRAIDACENTDESMAVLAALGVTHVLTSGGQQTALEGAEKLAVWQKAVGHKLQIIAGGSIRASNLQTLMDTTNCFAFHSAAITDTSHLPNGSEILKMVQLAQA